MLGHKAVEAPQEPPKRIPATHRISFRIFAIFMTLILLLITLLSILLYRFSVVRLEQLAIDHTKVLLEEINYNISTYIDNMKSMGQVVVENSDVRLLLASYNQYRGDPISESQENLQEELQLRASEHMNVVANTRSDITNIAIISKYEDVVISGISRERNPYSHYRVSDWFLQPLSYSEKTHVSPPHVQNLVVGEHPWVVSISEAVTDPYTDDVTGVMVIDIQYAAIAQLLEQVQLGKGSYIYIIDDKKNIITHPQQQLLYAGIKSEPFGEMLEMTSGEVLQKENVIYLKNRSEDTGWNAIGVIATEQLLMNREQVQAFFIFVAVVAIVLAGILAYIISTAITRPIGELKGSVNQVRDGDLTARSNIISNDEIGELSDAFNIMVSRIQNLIDEQVLIEQSKKQSEIRALQAQINPHFLYNTLDTIIWLSASGKNEEVMEVTEALAHLFRTSISDADGYITVGTEVNNIKNYLVIQTARYKNKLTYTVDVEPGVEDYRTPALVLQPLVENAIYHGIKTAPQGGAVRVSITRREDTLVYCVQDTGVGMPTEILETLLSPEKSATDSGVGITNVQNRIQLLFGKEYGLSFTSVVGEGTQVELTIPLLKEDSL